MSKGVLYALIAVCLWAVYDVYVRFVGVNFNVHPWVFISIANLVAAACLITASGRGPLGLQTLKDPHTWFFSFSNIFMDILFVYILLLISTTEANFIIRASIITTAIVVWSQNKRPLIKAQLIGYAMILGGVVAVASNLEQEVRAQAIMYLTIMVALMTVRTYVVETHTTSNKAESWSDKSRVTGYVLLATSLSFIIFGYLGALLKTDMSQAAIESSVIFNEIIPNLNEFINPVTFTAAFLLGVFNISFSNFFYFQSTKMIGSEQFLMVAAILPILTFVLEYVASVYGLLSINSVDHSDIYAGVVITAGAMFNVYINNKNLKRKDHNKKVKITPKDDYDTVNNALIFCNKDYVKAADKLGITVEELEKIKQAKGEIGFSGSVDKYKLIMRNFKRNIAMADALTGLANKQALIEAIEGALIDKSSFTIAFVDLDKFKPVNDTYGHEAGDKVLKTISKRFVKELPKTSLVARLGGDEFVIMLRHTSKAEAFDIMKDAIEAIQEDIYLNDETTVQVGGSFGLATAMEDGCTAEDLLEFADQAMYENKEPSER